MSSLSCTVHEARAKSCKHYNNASCSTQGNETLCPSPAGGGGGGVGALGREGNTVHVLNFSKFCGCSHHPQNNLSQKNIIGKIYMTVMANCVLPCGKTLSSLSFRNKMTTFETKC